MTPCSVVDFHKHFRGICYSSLHLSWRWRHFIYLKIACSNKHTITSECTNPVWKCCQRQDLLYTPNGRAAQKIIWKYIFLHCHSIKWKVMFQVGRYKELYWTDPTMVCKSTSFPMQLLLPRKLWARSKEASGSIIRPRWWPTSYWNFCKHANILIWTVIICIPFN